MNRAQHRTRKRSRDPKSVGNIDGKIQYLLSAEEHLLQAMSARAPLTGILNEICSALDCQVGNIVSLVSLSGNDASDLAVIARKAALFGLSLFSAESVVGENGEVLGTLDVYCCVPRGPSHDEFQLIQRASCLAAVAIELDDETNQERNLGLPGKRPTVATVLEWPLSLN